MQQIIGWMLIILPGILFVGQIISSVNFRLAQRLGLQESPDETDLLLQRMERYTAYWDLVTLGWLPLAGIFMVIDNASWPLVAFFGGAIYLDVSGREAAKILSLKHEGVKIGPPRQQRVFFSSYILMAIIAVVILVYSLLALLSDTAAQSSTFI